MVNRFQESLQMIWVNFAKKYLSAFAAKDLNQLKETYSDSIIFSNSNGVISGKNQLLLYNESIFKEYDMISISIQEVAYKNKVIFINYVITKTKEDISTSRDAVDIIQIDNTRIKSIKTFYNK